MLLIVLFLIIFLHCLAYIWKKNFKDVDNNFIKSFDVSENIQGFLTDHEASEFKFVSSIRFYTMLLIIWIHGIICFLYLPSSNPEFVEEVCL